jgi:hypothetical protein
MGDQNYYYDKLVVLNNIYKNELVHPLLDQSGGDNPSIKTKLYPHQTTMIQGMHAYREKMTRGFLVDNRAINSKIGVIGDPAGSGKTLCVLAYLASHKITSPKMSCELTNHSTKFFYSYDLNKLSENSYSNLIIVPHGLFSQWRHEIDSHTTMKYVAIETKRMCKGDTLATSICSSNFVLTTNKCYKFVQEYATANRIQWNNIFIDEASAIYINSTDPKLQFQFLWFITNNWIPLLFKNPSLNKSNLFFLKERVDIHPELEAWLLNNITVNYDDQLASFSFLKEYLPFSHENRSYILLRNSAKTIAQSIQLPDVKDEIVQCRPNLTLHALSLFYISRNIEAQIYSARIPFLFQGLGIPFQEVKDYLEFQLPNKYGLIDRRAKDNECVICYEECQYPTIVNCCYSVYCGKCLLKNTLLNYKCPMCREIITTANICCLSQLKQEDVLIARPKIDVCLQLLRENKGAQTIIYSAYDNIYYQIFEEISRLGLKVERIENNLFSLLKTIKNYKDGITNVLFVSDVNLLRGLSLTLTSHLIFYHELSSCVLKEVLICSSQRMGRQTPLKIVHLNSGIQI